MAGVRCASARTRSRASAPSRHAPHRRRAKAIDMMARRAKSRFTQGSSLADKQLVQAFVADVVPRS